MQQAPHVYVNKSMYLCMQVFVVVQMQKFQIILSLIWHYNDKHEL